MNDNSYLIEKRLKVVEAIKPICEAFEIKNYDYEVDIKTGVENLRVGNTRIGCSCNSVYATKQELVGYIFMSYWRERSLGAFDKQTRNVIKQYWI